MSSANFLTEERRAYEQYTKVVIGTYTAILGANHYRDRVLDVDDPADDFTLTVGSGSFMGQELTIVMSSNTSSKECSVSVTNHETTDPEVLYLNAADEYIKLLWTGTEWATISTTASTSSGG